MTNAPRSLSVPAADPAGGVARPSVGALWQALDAVPDPEIPAVSVVELGILRGVEWDAADPSLLVVTVTPTYSGCPATELIMASIRDAVAALGAARVRIDTRLAPAWTTDWMSADGRRRLRDYGIAPPDGARGAGGDRCCRNQSAAPCRRYGRLPALRVAADAVALTVRLDCLQGALPLPRLSRALRLFQAALMDEAATRRWSAPVVPEGRRMIWAADGGSHREVTH